MGYLTKYTLVFPNDWEQNELHEKQISEEFDTCFDDSIKWYDHKENMIEYSKKYPDTLFMIEGKGEETGDLWKLYVKNGKSFIDEPKIVWVDFKETMLE
jgi:hypothetical protein